MDLSGETAAGGAGAPTMSRSSRYYALHTEQRRKEALERYHINPEVIRRREERERLRAEKQAAKEAAKAAAREAAKAQKKEEREKAHLEKLAIAVATSKKPKEELAALVGGDLEEFLRRVKTEE